MRKRDYNYFDDDNEVEEEKEFSVEQVFEKAKEEAAKIREKDNRKYLAKVKLGNGSIVAIILVAAIIISSVATVLALHSNTKSENKYNDEAGSVVTDIIANYGTCKTETYQFVDDTTRYMMTGLSYARQMDFNNDGDDELLVAYNNNNVYAVEVWAFEGSNFEKVYSDVANINSSVGSWITLYHDGKKYYIGNLSSDNTTMELLSFNGKKFKESKECQYDLTQDLYSIKDEIVSIGFETIRLNNLSSTKAQLMVDEISENISSLNTRSAEEIEESKTETERKYDAYYEIIEEYNKEYGAAGFKEETSICYATGLCSVDLIDFDGDSNDELFIVYRYNKKVSGEDDEGNLTLTTEPAYKMEIYRWNGTNAVQVLENDGISEFEGDPDSAYYIFQKDDLKTNYCRNSFTYDEDYPKRVWNGTSKILEMNENYVFEATYTSEISMDWGYSSYKIDGERVRSSKFKSEGYKVPYFYNEDSYDYSTFTVYFLEGSLDKSTDIQNVVSETKKTITQINPNYNG